MPSIGARTSTNVSIQRVDSPIATRNLDATKIKPRPPSSCFSRNTVKSRNEKFRESKEIKKEVETRVKKIDLTHRDGFFCGTADSINSRLIYLADIGRCDLYGKSAKRMGGDQEALLAISNKTGGTSSDVTRWVTLSNEEFKKKQRARLASNEPRLIETYEAPGFEDVIHERIPLPFNISIDELVEKIEEVDDINYKWYCINRLKTCHGLIKDAFWWIFFDRFFAATKNRNSFTAEQVQACKDELIYKIAQKFVKIILDSEQKSASSSFVGNRHVQFFNQLAKLVSLIVYSGFCHAWKDSWRRFVDSGFRQYLMDTFSLWIEGIRHIPGEGEDDQLWQRMEPFMLRKDRLNSNKKGKSEDSNSEEKGSSSKRSSKGGKTVASHLEETLGNDICFGEQQKWKRGLTRITIFNKLGNSNNNIPNARFSRRRETVTMGRMSIKCGEKNSLLISKDKSLTFDSSKFDINGCSPLFQMVFPSNKSQILVSRRNCLDKPDWKDNPLVKTQNYINNARTCYKRAKKFNSNLK